MNTIRTEENIRQDILQYLTDNKSDFNYIIEELDNYNGYLNDDRYYLMEELTQFYTTPEDIENLLFRIYYGHDEDNYITDSSGNTEYREFNPNREYFKYNGYGNLVSTDYPDYSAHLDNYLIDELLENRADLYEIGRIPELSALFDELEEV